MAKKKKKPAANPARGFATTSIASKPKPEQASDVSDNENSTKSHNNSKDIKSSSDAIKTAGGDPKEKEFHELTAEELDEHLDRHELQAFVEAHGPKSTKDANRQISKVQTDSRVVRPQSFYINTVKWLAEDLLDEVINVAKQDLSHTISTPLPKDVTEDDWLTRFWILFRTLLGIGIPKERILQLLRNLHLKDTADPLYIWGLRDCLDVLALNDDQSDLPPYDSQRRHLLELPEDSDVSRPPTGTVTPARSTKSVNVIPNEPKIVQILDVEDDFDVSDIDSDVETDQLISKYVSTKSKLFSIHPDLAGDLTKKSKTPKPTITSNSLSVRKLQDKLRRIENDPLFDDYIAYQKWTIEKIKIARDNPNSTKRSLLRQEAMSSGDESSHSIKRSTVSTHGDASEESDNGGLLGEIFSAPGMVEQAVDMQSDAPVTLRDIGKITGVNARRLLEDTCRARDSNVKLHIRQVSPTTYSCRHQIIVSWSRSQDRILEPTPPGVSFVQDASSRDASRVIASTFTMSTVATIDSKQSEAFVCTVALFCLFSSSPKEEKVFLKLGHDWRDLWQELLAFRKEHHDAADREDVKILRQLVRDRMQAETDNGLVFSAAFRPRDSNIANSKEHTGQDHASFEYPSWLYAQQMWQSRVASAAYQVMLQGRILLPMFGFRQVALSIIYSNQVTILCGETGCGKSTQLPAYILEDHLAQGVECRILCTEPRRISAISLAARVSQELGESLNEVGSASSLVGYAVRLETKIGVLTRLTFATVGVVLRMLESPKGLDDITHLIIDEVHERSIETDFLLVILRNIMTRRPELKVILMSATVDAAKFSKYLDDAPVIEVPGRTFPVNTFYLEDAFELTNYAGGKRKAVEVEEQEDGDYDQKDSGLSSELQGYSAATRTALAEYDEYRVDYQLIVNLIETVLTKPEMEPYAKAILVFLPGIGEIRELNDMLSAQFDADCRIYPLHSSISSDEQQAAFVIPPKGEIKIVLSTNIAETGVTIPDVTCVIDTGKHKEMRYDERRQLSRLVQAFISRANAKQRRGRAGRVQEGICFHLFTKRRHDELMASQQTPEMLRLSLQDLAMRVKISKLGDIEETLGQALDPPSGKNIRRAIDSLIDVGALTQTEELTPLGRQLAKLPLDAHLGKLCLLSAIFGCLDAGLTIAAILSSKSPFLTPFGARQQADLARIAFSRGDSDLLTVYNAYSAWRRVSETHNENVYAFCRKNFLSPTVLSNIEDLKSQLLQSLTDTGLVKFNISDYPKRNHHHHGKRGFVRIPPHLDTNSSNDTITSSVIAWAFYPKLLLRDGKGFRSVANNQPITLHPTSVNKGNDKLKYLSYYSIMQSGSKFYNATNAHSTTIAHEVPLVLLAGEAEFKVHAGILAIDSNRLRFKVGDWKTIIALKMIRRKLEEYVRLSIEKPGVPIGEELSWWQQVFERMCSLDGNSKES